MVAIRGHIVTLHESAGTGHMDYMLTTRVTRNGKFEYIYMFPKNVSVTPEHPEGVECAGVLGGTFIPHADELSPPELEELDRHEFQRLLERHSEFFLGHPYAQ